MKTKDELPVCPVATAVSLVGGKWKLLIIRNLRMRPWRFNELQRDLEGISQKVLTDSLRQMMDDGLVYRHDYQEMPPRVDYSLTELGEKLLPIMDALADFGNYYKSAIKKTIRDSKESILLVPIGSTLRSVGSESPSYTVQQAHGGKSIMNQYVTGTTIKELREKNKITQVQLAEKLGVSDKTVSKWECGVSHS